MPVSPHATLTDLFPPLPYESPDPINFDGSTFSYPNFTAPGPVFTRHSNLVAYSLSSDSDIAAARRVFSRYAHRALDPAPSFSSRREAIRLLLTARELSSRASTFLASPTSARLHRFRASLTRLSQAATVSTTISYLDSLVPPVPFNPLKPNRSHPLHWLSVFDNLVSAARHFFPLSYLVLNHSSSQWTLYFQTHPIKMRFLEGFLPNFTCDSDNLGQYLLLPAVRGILPLHLSLNDFTRTTPYANSPDASNSFYMSNRQIEFFQPYSIRTHSTRPRPGSTFPHSFRHPHISSSRVSSPYATICHSNHYKETCASRYYNGDYYSLIADTLSVLSTYNPGSPYFQLSDISASGPITVCPHCNESYDPATSGIRPISRVTPTAIRRDPDPHHAPCLVPVPCFHTHFLHNPTTLTDSYELPSLRITTADPNYGYDDTDNCPLHITPSFLDDYCFSHHTYTINSHSISAFVRSAIRDTITTPGQHKPLSHHFQARFVRTLTPHLSVPTPSFGDPSPPLPLPATLISNHLPLYHLFTCDPITEQIPATLSGSTHTRYAFSIPLHEQIYFANAAAIDKFLWRYDTFLTAITAARAGRTFMRLNELPPHLRPILLLDPSPIDNPSSPTDLPTTISRLSDFFRVIVCPPFSQIADTLIAQASTQDEVDRIVADHFAAINSHPIPEPSNVESQAAVV